MKWEYAFVLGCTMLFPFALSFDKKLTLYRRAGALFKSMGIACVVFWVWDVMATARGHWSFNPQFTLGVDFLGLPLEEWLFFVVVSFVSIFTWESTKYFLGNKK
jgi:lycopene cyclase domain-containing protein